MEILIVSAKEAVGLGAADGGRVGLGGAGLHAATRSIVANRPRTDFGRIPASPPLDVPRS